jgi:hypothetical protein
MTRMVSALVLLGMLITAGSAHATANCYKKADGSGHCDGSLTDFKAPGIGYANFLLGNKWAEFYAAFKGGEYRCDANTSSEVYPTMVAALSAYRLYFQVDWDASGQCTYVTLQNATWLQ